MHWRGDKARGCTLTSSSHFKRVVGYARVSDYVAGLAVAAFSPAALYTLEKFAPSYVGKGGFAKAMRLAGVVGLTGGFLYFYQRSASTFAEPRSAPPPLLPVGDCAHAPRGPLFLGGVKRM